MKNTSNKENLENFFPLSISHDKAILADITNMKDKWIRYKTEICKNWVSNKICPYSTKCKFAHGYHELNAKPEFADKRYKSKFCTSFHQNNYCSYGSRCTFIHEQRPFFIIQQSIYSKIIEFPMLREIWLKKSKKKRLSIFEKICRIDEIDSMLKEEEELFEMINLITK